VKETKEEKKMRAPKDHVSETRTPYAVDCIGLLPGFSCGKTYLTEKGYMHQMAFADATWKCPICGGDAYFDDDNFEKEE
jgi:hypothetical protein